VLPTHLIGPCLAQATPRSADSLSGYLLLGGALVGALLGYVVSARSAAKAGLRSHTTLDDFNSSTYGTSVSKPPAQKATTIGTLVGAAAGAIAVPMLSVMVTDHPWVVASSVVVCGLGGWSAGRLSPPTSASFTTEGFHDMPKREQESMERRIHSEHHDRQRLRRIIYAAIGAVLGFPVSFFAMMTFNMARNYWF
jgi:hypothetical protein